MHLIAVGAAAGMIMGAIDAPALLDAHGILTVTGAVILGSLCGALAGALYAALIILLIKLITTVYASLRNRSIPPSAQMFQFALPGVFLGVIVGGLIMIKPAHALLAMTEMAIIISACAALIAPHIPARWRKSRPG
jgi:hypothetical protein